MRFISTRVHGILDYFSGLLLIIAPWTFDFANGGAAQWVPVLVGVTILVMSLLTDYEFSFVKKIPMPAHLTMDVLGGALLAVSPWLFGFDELVYLPHLILGIAEIGAGLMTKKVPDYKRPDANTAGSETTVSGDTARDPDYQARQHSDGSHHGNVIDTENKTFNADAKQRRLTNEQELEMHERAKKDIK